MGPELLKQMLAGQGIRVQGTNPPDSAWAWAQALACRANLQPEDCRMLQQTWVLAATAAACGPMPMGYRV